jgi:hypothetical protein
VGFAAKEWLVENPASSAWVQALVEGDRAELRLGDRQGSAAITAPIEDFVVALERLQTLVASLLASLGYSTEAKLCYQIASAALLLVGRRPTPWFALSDPARQAWVQLHEDLGYMTDTEVLWYSDQVRADPTLSAFVSAYLQIREVDARPIANANVRDSDPR